VTAVKLVSNAKLPHPGNQAVHRLSRGGGRWRPDVRCDGLQRQDDVFDAAEAHARVSGASLGLPDLSTLATDISGLFDPSTALADFSNLATDILSAL